ncbi:MAG: hypothetical protein R2710_05815 [Acidimicrobiales bacterium]
MLSLPYFVIVEALAPLVEAIGILLLIAGLALGQVSLGHLLFVGSAYALGLLVSMMVLLLDDAAFGMLTDARMRVRMVLIVAVEHLIFRPLTIFWRLEGLVFYAQARATGVQVRRGFGTNCCQPRHCPARPGLPKAR